MRTGFVILAHQRLDRAAQLARHITGHGAPVVVHVDPRCREPRPDFGGAQVFSAHEAEWGMMGLVDATLDAAARLLRDHPATAHVMLASGSCLPVRPIPELEYFLETRPGADFIESVPVAEADWVQGGLSHERFSLWFPLPWKRRRRSFDRLVEVQRLLRVNRRMPEGLAPHLGSQWWCLSARTLTAILEDPRLPAWRRYFRTTWIPDECFFQTLVRALGDREALVPRSLTLARFDHSGQPYVFHDDHAAWLAGIEPYFARKIDPDAEGLYRNFLVAPDHPHVRPGFTAEIDTAPFDAARRARLEEPRGLQTQSRYPSGSGPRLLGTAAPWACIAGTDADLLAAAAAALRDRLPEAEAEVHGRLFAPEGATFADGGVHGPGNLPADATLRDYRPEQFLARLVFARQPVLTVFTFAEGDTPRAGQMAARDANARLVLLAADVAEADRILAALRTRDPGKGRPPVIEPLHATVTRVDPDALRRDLAAAGGGPALDSLAAAVTGRAAASREARASA